jgi:hypothetical protein
MQLKKYYASHLREIPLDDGTKPVSSGEVYSIPEVDAEIARLNAEAEILRETANVARHNNTLNQEDHEAEAKLLKAALRWSMGAPLMAVEGDTGEIYDAESGFAVEIPPEFAPLIAEAVKP